MGVTSAVDAMLQGASDYVTKPVRLQELLVRIEKAREKRRLAAQGPTAALPKSRTLMPLSKPFMATSASGLLNGIITSSGGIVSWIVLVRRIFGIRGW